MVFTPTHGGLANRQTLTREIRRAGSISPTSPATSATPTRRRLPVTSTASVITPGHGRPRRSTPPPDVLTSLRFAAMIVVIIERFTATNVTSYPA